MGDLRSPSGDQKNKRLKAYKQIGYDIFTGTGAQKQTVNAVFDIDNYADVYRNDLFTAEKEIIISSPAISGRKVYEMIHLLREKQEAGVKLSLSHGIRTTAMDMGTVHTGWSCRNR